MPSIAQRRLPSRGAFAGSVALALVTSGATAAACGPADDGADREVLGEVLDRTAEGLAVGALVAANGTYGAGCVARSGGWSVRLSGNGALANPALSVVDGNTSCTLTLTEVVASATYALSPAVVLSTAYQATSSSAATGSSAFLVNAKLDATSFDGPFALTVLTSDDPSVSSAGLTAAYSAASGLSVVATTSNSTNDSIIILTKPTGTTQGMLMVAGIASESNKTASLSGWTSLGHASNVVGLDMLYRVAGAAEPATYTFAMSGSTKSAGGLITISGANASPLDATGAAASSWTAPSVTTLTNGAIVVGCWANVASASTPPATMTERFDLPYSDKIVGACSTELRPTAGATGTRTATGTGIDPSSRLVAFKP